MSGSSHDSESEVKAAASGAGSVTGLLLQLKDCDAAILGEVWRRFFPRMAGLARETLRRLPGCGVETDDVAQSAFISFWKALERGSSLEFHDRDDLWRLLGVITARKARKRVRREMAQKRGGGKTRRASDLETPEGAAATSWQEALADVSPPDLDLQCEELLLNLKEGPRLIAVLRLHGYSSQEIAAQLSCSPRTVQRQLDAIRRQWEQAADVT
jgi:RNA polymerase sigma factor (sigma-70 family)